MIAIATKIFSLTFYGITWFTALEIMPWKCLQIWTQYIFYPLYICTMYIAMAKLCMDIIFSWNCSIKGWHGLVFRKGLVLFEFIGGVI